MGVHMRGYIIYYFQEIRYRHIGLIGYHAAIASAMAAGDIAPERTFPKQGTYLVQCFIVVPHFPEQLQSDPFP
jgi:hypothetical protein